MRNLRPRTLCFGGAGLLAVVLVGTAAPAADLQPRLLHRLRTAASGERFEVYVLLANQLDPIANSCSYKFIGQPNYAAWRTLSESLRLAGVPHSNSIGNQSQLLDTHPIPYNIPAPADAPPSWLHQEQPVFAGLGGVLATGTTEIDLTEHEPTGRGPAAWEDTQKAYLDQQPIPPEMWDYPWSGGVEQDPLKPEIVMPTNVWSLDLDHQYNFFDGTSAAAPHTGGALRLLLTAAPNATPETLSDALQTCVLDLGAADKDKDYGAGLPNLPAAAESLWLL